MSNNMGKIQNGIIRALAPVTVASVRAFRVIVDKSLVKIFLQGFQALVEVLPEGNPEEFTQG